ncbi:DUF2806 domain-containing protein [Mesorhizobium sp. f-mel]
MEKEDHLDKETSVSAEITPTLLKASARSRAIAAFDRMVGNVFERISAPMEAKTAEARAISDSRLKFIEALTTMGLEKFHTDPEAAARAIENHFGKIFGQHNNKEAVVAAAIEDLREQPPSDQEASSGGDRLEGIFIDRFERYAEEATTDELREKWGRVLAAEIRKPGTFSAKVLRAVDELDATTALLFEKVCKSRVGNLLPKSTVGELTFAEIAQLTEGGLLIDPGLGQVSMFSKITNAAGIELWFASYKRFGLSFLQSETITWTKDLLQERDGRPAIPVYVLTEVGYAVSSILPDTEFQALSNIASKLATTIGNGTKIRKYSLGHGNRYVQLPE